MKDGMITIGGLASQAGVNIETIRYYQRRGLLDVPPKPPGGVRRYAGNAIQRVRFIKRAQALGFTLDEVSSLLQLNDGVHCDETRELAERKLAMIQAKLADLEKMRATLSELVRECRAGNAQQCCPIIASLGEGDIPALRGDLPQAAQKKQGTR